MNNLSTTLQKLATLAIQQAFEGVASELAPHLPAEVVPSTQPQFGHYQCNTALRLAKVFKKNPREVAQNICNQLLSLKNPMISTVEIAGPGFLNITLDSQFLSSELNEVLRDPKLGVERPAKCKKIVVDFSSPNIAKELHVGHLRSTIIGDSLCRLFEFRGHDVLRINHVGDWGTQFGMLIAYLKEFEPELLSGEKKSDLTTLMQLYRSAKKHFDADADFKKRSQNEVIGLQAKDEASIKAWEQICKISREGFQEIYDRLNVKLIERGESFNNPFLKGVIDDAEKSGHLSVSNGAKCIFLEGFQNKEGELLPLILQKSDGGYNYATTDMAALHYRIMKDHADRIIYVVDAGQRLHFDMLFKGAEKIGYVDPKKVELNHVPFGVVLGPDGKKFKTRSGETERLMDLITKAVDEASKISRERLPHASDEEISHMAEVLGIDSIKYSDLSGSRIKDYVFSYERMLRFEGNTAPYLLYSFVRVQGIKRKIGKDIEDVMQKHTIKLEHPTEIALGLYLRQFGEVIEVVENDLFPHHLCEYLYNLAQKFHHFFRDCRVEGSPEEGSRLLLCEVTARILEQTLNLLGLKTLNRM